MKKILIIEDDRVVANIYSNKLRVEGHQVEVAADGLQGKNMVTSYLPDLIILDLNLPKLNGVEIIKHVRAQPTLKATPVIVFSNSYLSNLVQEAWKAGATKCLSKIDCTPKHMLDIVERLLTVAPAPAAPAAVAPVPAAPSAPPTPAGGERRSDEAFQADLLRSFLDGGPQTIAGLRNLLVSFNRSETDADRLGRLHDLNRQMRLISGNAAIVGLTQMARMAAALEALLKELYEKPKNISASTTRTVAQTLDFLSLLFQHGTAFDGTELAAASSLVVDDEVISRRAVTYSLDKAQIRSTSLEDPAMALRFLEDNSVDLIVLDIEMPGMNGFELCTKLRTLPRHATTPVIFVTSHTDFESRAKSIMSGGNDLIAKPFLFMELAVKALNHILRYHLTKRGVIRTGATGAAISPAVSPAPHRGP